MSTLNKVERSQEIEINSVKINTIIQDESRILAVCI